MQITVTKTITAKEELDLNFLKVYLGGQRDVESTNLSVYYRDVEIAFGHLNNRSNMAHISIIDDTMNKDEACELISFLEEGIEDRSLLK